MAATPIPSVSLVSTLDNPADLTTGTAADATNGNSTPNNGRVHLFVQNTGASSDTVNVTRTEIVDGAALPVRPLVVAAGKNLVFGPFDVRVFGATLQYKAGAATTKVIPLYF